MRGFCRLIVFQLAAAVVLTPLCSSFSVGPLCMSSSSAPFKVLVLHGKGDTKENFGAVLEPLRTKLRQSPAGRDVQWEFLTAPHEIAPGRFAWWTLPPGVRSFDASEYIGIDESFKLIEDHWTKQGPYDCILGHSQGAIILSVILAKASLEGYSVKPPFGILCGAAWPKPFESLLERMGAEGTGKYEFQTLHSYSPKDSINPPEHAQKIQSLCGASASAFSHDGGHIVPMDDEAVGAFTNFLFPS
mmetsp:Transcript_20753/g.40340  ORF Transcript_20753/g.40340 Transcript_20753/m.40340 type:complete len:245 (+) Transcript_20753:118-852(+)